MASSNISVVALRERTQRAMWSQSVKAMRIVETSGAQMALGDPGDVTGIPVQRAATPPT
jgi:hypothetical protein